MDDYRPLEKHYRTYTYFLKKKFGAKVLRISLDGGFSCPNKDNGKGGCIFCNSKSFSPASQVTRGITEQIDHVWSNVKHREKYAGFIAYFQPNTNTYAPLEKLKNIYNCAISKENCLGLAIGTRPDCLPDDVLDLLEKISQNIFVTVELGMQSIYDESLRWMNRGHNFNTFKTAVKKLSQRNIHIGAHVILGIPGESKEMMLEGAKQISGLPIDVLKIHQLQIIKNTPLEVSWLNERFPLWTMEDYADFVTEYIKHLKEDIVIQRLFSKGVYGEVIAPDFSMKELTQLLHHQLKVKNVIQGSSL